MFAELSDVRCCYELLGSGDPILLIPGLGCTRAFWDNTATELASSFCVIVFDNRGIGGSVAKRPPQTLADFAVDLVELMDHLQLERTHVIGTSLGGMIAQQLANDHPSRVDRLVLVSCSNRFGPYLREIASLLGRAIRHFPAEVFQRTVELLGSSPQYLDSHAAEIERKIAETRGKGIPRLAVARQLRCLARHDTQDPVEYRISAPTLVIAAEHDMLIPAVYVRRMAEQIPGSEFMLIPGCGHNPFNEMPEIILPRIEEFLMKSRESRERRHQDIQAAVETAV